MEKNYLKRLQSLFKKTVRQKNDKQKEGATPKGSNKASSFEPIGLQPEDFLEEKVGIKTLEEIQTVEKLFTLKKLCGKGMKSELRGECWRRLFQIVPLSKNGSQILKNKRAEYQNFI